ncbi:MAG: HPr family phosphocarrier protein [Puniceicoccales bacterium]|jgi:phosphotransferase system HPr (HPr) family protein|nr:HPr family phosphocarrier protein [Puniceicoccales bacterium]
MIESEVYITCDIDYAAAFKITQITQKLSGTSITLSISGKLVNCSNIFQLLSIAAKKGTPCHISINGDDETIALEKILQILYVS